MDYVVIKIGGSLVSPKPQILDKELLAGYAKSIREFFAGGEKEKRIVFVVGGGYVSRYYRDVAVACGNENTEDVHRVGISATWINAELVRTILSDITYEKTVGVGVYADPSDGGREIVGKEIEKWLAGKAPVLICGGFIKSVSTDYDSILLAEKLGINRIIKLSGVDYVYTKDPNQFQDAEKIEYITWTRYLDMFPQDKEHAPGAHVPIDVVAAKLAKDKKIGCYFAGGRNPVILLEILQEKSFSGTIIRAE